MSAAVGGFGGAAGALAYELTVIPSGTAVNTSADTTSGANTAFVHLERDLGTRSVDKTKAPPNPVLLMQPPNDLDACPRRSQQLLAQGNEGSAKSKASEPACHESVEKSTERGAVEINRG